MNIDIKINEKPNLTVCKMNCDNDLDENLNKYELTKLSFSNHSMNLFLGKPQSGKTSFIYSLFKGSKQNRILKGVYSTIYLFQPSNSRKSMNDNIFDTLPDDQKFDELTYENLNYVYEKAKEDSMLGFTTCIIFDDMGAYLKNKETMQLFKEIAFNRRHLKISMFFLCQTWHSVNKELRRLWTSLFIFSINPSILSEILLDMININNKDIVNKIYKIVYNEKYNYLMIHPDSQRLFKNFDELIIK
jgi:hypothetical protein